MFGTSNTKRCTIIVKTFLRDAYFLNCIDSIRRTYPDARIAVADDSYKSGDALPEWKASLYADLMKRDGNVVLRLPFDSGLCVGRNALVERITTEYVVIGDDDFEYAEGARIERMIAFLDAHPEYALVGGRIIEGDKIRDYQGTLEREPGFLHIKALPTDIEYRLERDYFRYCDADITFNFFVARTEVVRQVKWDDEIKVAYEHCSFFLDMKEAGHRCAFTPDALVLHKPHGIREPNVMQYRPYRSRKSDKQRFFDKFKLNKVVDMRGYVDTPPSAPSSQVQILIKTFKRPAHLERLLMSIARHAPHLPVLIGDDSGRFNADHYKALWERLFAEGIQLKPTALNFGRDIGLAAGRNRLVDAAESPYVLMCDDDFLLTGKTDIDAMARILDARPDIGIVGGALMADGENLMQWRGRIERDGDGLRFINDLDGEPDELSDGTRFTYHDYILNFFLARREALESCGWDDHFKIYGEHTDFFLRFRDSGYRIAYCPSSVATHYPLGTDEEFDYVKYKGRLEFLPHLFVKHGLTRLDLPDVVYTYDPVTERLDMSRK